jgi:L-malate glycosyltransferase
VTKKVAIVWRYLADYRLPFYRYLKEYLAQRDIELKLIYGSINGNGPTDDMRIALPWADCVNHWGATIRGVEVCWQPYGPHIRDADLVIVEQANRLLLNYWLIAKRRFVQQKIAFWGHGRDLQTSARTIRNAWKRLFVTHVDWWFAYTEQVKEELVKCGFPAERITNVQNAIDTAALLRARSEISDQQLNTLKQHLGLGVGPIGIYCGRIYKEKRIEFLLETCRRVREQIPSFELIVIGSGEEKDKVISAARNCQWLHYVGPKYGDERVPYFLVSDVFLMPGLVGLAVLDSFALEIPLITTAFRFHSPEVTYLRNNENGLITNDNLDDYVAGIHKLLSDSDGLTRLKSGCRAAASVYTMKTMVENFGKGIVACLADGRSRLPPTAGEHVGTSRGLRDQALPLSHKVQSLPE